MRALVEFAASREGDELGRTDDSQIGFYLNALRTVRECDPILDGSTTVQGWSGRRKFKSLDYLFWQFRDVIEAEGESALVNYRDPAWPKRFLQKCAYFRDIEFHYQSSASDSEEPSKIDRESVLWKQIVRRNVTLPQGLVFEVDAVLTRLRAQSQPVKLSFSALLELALRQLIARPVDEDDGRFYDEEEDEFIFEPELDYRTIVDLAKESTAGARRTPVTAEAEHAQR